jgi:opacity protein-like surface antigen
MKLKGKFRRIATLTTLSAVVMLSSVRAQVVPAAFESRHVLWAGAEYSNIHASFPYQSGQRLQGAGAFADFHLNYRLDIEGEALFLRFGGFEGSTESNYLAGPVAYPFTKGRLRFYGKLLAGAGRIHYPFAIGDASYFALAPGAGATYRIDHHWMLRIGYEYELWLNSPGYTNEPNHELTPNGFHLGVAYRVFR